MNTATRPFNGDAFTRESVRVNRSPLWFSAAIMSPMFRLSMAAFRVASPSARVEQGLRVAVKIDRRDTSLSEPDGRR